MIYFTLAEWRFGLLLSVYTEKGLRTVILGTKTDDLIKDLYVKFPKAEQAPKGHILHKTTETLIRYVDSPISVYKGDLDLQGTDFQKDVWKILQAIPLGEVMSYSAVAEKIHRPKAYRAVAQACGANLLPLVIPCHRVVGKEGLGGFRYGLSLKEKLLEKEELQAKQYNT